MSVTETEEEEEDVGKVVQLRVVPGGKEPPKDNWLADLPIGANFLARPRTWNAPEVMQYSILDKTKKATQLVVHLAKDDLCTWEDTAWFSRVYELFEELDEDK